MTKILFGMASIMALTGSAWAGGGGGGTLKQTFTCHGTLWKSFNVPGSTVDVTVYQNEDYFGGSRAEVTLDGVLQPQTPEPALRIESWAEASYNKENMEYKFKSPGEYAAEYGRSFSLAIQTDKVNFSTKPDMFSFFYVYLKGGETQSGKIACTGGWK